MLVEGRVAHAVRHHRRRVRARPAVHRPRGSPGRPGRGGRRQPVGGPLRQRGPDRQDADARPARPTPSSASCQKRRGGFLGENRQDNVLNLPAGTVRNRFGEPERVVIYMRAKPGQREACLPRGGGHPAPAAPAAATARTTTSTSRPPIRSSRPSTASARASAWRPSAWRPSSLLIGAIGIANVMFISVTERTREIGLRMARRRAAQGRFCCSSCSKPCSCRAIGGLAGVATALAIGLLLTFVVSGLFGRRARVGGRRRPRGVGRRRHRRRLLAGAARVAARSGGGAAPRVVAAASDSA